MNIGQIRASVSKPNTDLALNIATEELTVSIGNASLTYQDGSITLSKAKFKKGVTYGLKLSYSYINKKQSIHDNPSPYVEGILKLKTRDTNKSMVITSLPPVQRSHGFETTIKIIFTPNRDYNYLLLELIRTSSDDYGKDIYFQVDEENTKIQELKNLLP
jgi:hypothetical protein